MLLKRLALRNYATFARADFNLETTFEKPIVLFTGNNGAGKTSTLEAFRLALYGKKAYTAITDDEYQRIIRGRFKDGNFDEPATIELAFDYADAGVNHHVELTRSWNMRRKTIGEALTLSLDGISLEEELAEDLLCSIVPPEVLRYFFFDGEKIAELADWEGEDDSALFSSVNDLLGLNIARQLERDLEHVIARAPVQKGPSLLDLSEELSLVEADSALLRQELKAKRHDLTVARRRQEACRRRFSALGGVFAEERAKDEAQLAEYKAQTEALEEAIRADAASIMPLLIAPRVFGAMELDVAKSEALEVLAVIQHALAESRDTLAEKLKRLIDAKRVPSVLDAVREALLPKPVALDHEPLDLSLREASWMRSVLSRELAALRQRLTDMLGRHGELQRQMDLCKARLQLAPTNDKALEDAVAALEQASADVTRAQDAVNDCQRDLDEMLERLDGIREQLRKARYDNFRDGRLAVRDELVEKILTMLPDFAAQLRQRKERRFGALLGESLSRLWHKTGRLESVVVDLANQNIDLLTAKGALQKRDLSAAEKQLFAISFIFSLAKLSNRNLPFVIDTPLARLDATHRIRLLAEFLPSSTHQAVLFSTDTEVVGSLFNRTERFINHHYELAEYNGGVTKPVQLAIAL